MEKLCRFSAFLLVAVSGWSIPVRAQIPTEERMSVDFSDAKTGRQTAEWREATGLDVTRNGLGFDSPKPGTLDPHGWVLTHPLAVGLAWRPPSSVEVSVMVAHMPWSDSVINTHLHSSEADSMFVRHSPDRMHWSSWQELEVDEPKNGERFLKFHGNVGVPRRSRTRYEDLCLEYMRMDVAWGSDEEATVRWIISREPGFLAKETPFVGYVQFLYETTFEPGERLRSIQAVASATLGGESTLPRDPKEKPNLEGPWRYVAPSDGRSAGP